MTSDIMTTREVVALILNLTNIAELLRLAAGNTIVVDNTPLAPCDPKRLENIADNLYRYAHRLNTLVPDDEVVVGDDKEVERD